MKSASCGASIRRTTKAKKYNLTTGLRQGAFQDTFHMPIFLPMAVHGVRKPFHSWNAVWAQFAWFADVWRDAMRARRPLDRLAIWGRRTGWRPADVA